MTQLRCDVNLKQQDKWGNKILFKNINPVGKRELFTPRNVLLNIEAM